ncbi:hypothetical protein Ddye_013301 [Dipteronia dyeriana]|uniref:Uncharacterized protein n=1 Tax=Dipteronia dyeriana TaxID=168575 RepID=A0AAD9X5W2_9ROSI|nr:hypothetical protein Ddye_013301 [Dipteronia dyeriana]
MWILERRAQREAGFTEQRLPPSLGSERITGRCHLGPTWFCGLGSNWTITSLINIQNKNSESALMTSPSTKRFTNICVFGGTNYGKYKKFVDVATHLGKVLAERKIHLVYGGGNLGLMGYVS